MALLDDLIPRPLNLWTPADLALLRERKLCESLFLELKASWDPDDVARHACAFANAYGGLLVYGARQENDGCIRDYPGLAAAEEWPRLARDRIVGQVAATPVWNAVQLDSPDQPGSPVLVIRVEASERTPHLLTRNGRIIVRTPTGSEVVKDKATIDRLVERGSRGRESIDARLLEMESIPWRSTAVPADWVLDVSVIPSPRVGRIYSGLLTEQGYRDANQVFAGSPWLKQASSRRLMEEGVILETGLAAVARFDDGAMKLRVAFRPESEQRYIVTDDVANLTAAMIRAADAHVPAIRSAFVRVALGQIKGYRARPRHDPRTHISDGSFSSADWSLGREIPTDPPAAEAFSKEVERRLWRSIGEPRFEPPIAAGEPVG